MRKVIYTAISGNYDTLKEPLIVTEGWEYICFTDNKELKSNIWHIVYLTELLTVRDAREIKIKTPFIADTSIWIDGSMEINCDLDIFIKTYHSGNFTLMKHNLRDCVYQEAEACIKRKKDSVENIERQMNRYHSTNYPKNNGMVATGVMIRNEVPIVREFCKRWFYEVQEGSHRDQLSFNYTDKHYPINYNLIPFDILKTDFILQKHS